jgi:hypothetical protein
VSAADDRYRWPASGRRAGGGFSVEEAASRLLAVCRLQRACVRALAGALIRIGPLELKIELAHHLYQHAEAAAALRQRLRELRVSDKTLDAPLPSWLDDVVDALLRLDDPVVFALAIDATLVDEIQQALRRYTEAADALLDQPTLRLLRPIASDLDAMRAWSGAVARCAVDAGDAPEAWQAATQQVRGLMQAPHDGPSSDGSSPASAARYQRPHACARDDRLPVFHHTRRYGGEDLPAGRPAADGLAAQVLELFRVQRDELDAIETFANIIYDMRPAFELELFLARLVWDEARHAEMGQQHLERLGLDPFAVPCGVIGINVRSPLAPLLAFAQISIFGELHQVGTLRRIADRCDAAGDALSARAFDFTHADELMHLRIGRQWLRQLACAAGMTLETLEQQALEQALRRLREENVLGENYCSALTAADLAVLIGE